MIYNSTFDLYRTYCIWCNMTIPIFQYSVIYRMSKKQLFSILLCDVLYNADNLKDTWDPGVFACDQAPCVATAKQ